MRCKCNLWQEIKHLLALVDGLLDEFDIDFGLTARGYTMKQHGLVLAKSSLDALIGFLLCLCQLNAIDIGLHLELF